MKITIDVGKMFFGASGAEEKGWKWNSISPMNTGGENADKMIPMADLDQAFNLLGPSGKRDLMAYIQSQNPRSVANGYIKQSALNYALNNAFGEEASALLLKAIE